jgi:prefoldin subunit 1
MEIEQKSQFSSQQIQIVKGQMTSKARENRMLQLTASEVGALPKETHVYEGVGKMFVKEVSCSDADANLLQGSF